MVHAFCVPCDAQITADSVCQILNQLDEFSGQMVVVRALVSSGGYLQAEDCLLDLRIGQHKVSLSIATDWPGSTASNLGPVAVAFPVDEESRQLFRVALEARRGRNPRLRATLEGQIVTRTPPLLGMVVHGRPDLLYGFGVGHGSSPALMIIRRVSNVEVSRELDDGSRERFELTGSDPISERLIEARWRRHQQALWQVVKKELARPADENDRDASLVGMLFPGITQPAYPSKPGGHLRLRGTVLSLEPPNQPKVLTLAISDGRTPEVKLALKVPLGYSVECGERVEFEGIITALSREPFLLTLTVNPEQVNPVLGEEVPAVPAPIELEY
jgi:hypothetical protein